LYFFLSDSIQAFSFVTVLVSYTFVIFAILKKKSVKNLKKAFSTGGSHLLSATLYFGTIFFLYARPASAQRDDQDMIDSHEEETGQDFRQEKVEPSGFGLECLKDGCLGLTPRSQSFPMAAPETFRVSSLLPPLPCLQVPL
jgi:hypothetical protein